jgi:hypothetical protein
MTFAEYRALDWQARDEAYWDWCDRTQTDHTDPDAFNQFVDDLVDAAEVAA